MRYWHLGEKSKGAAALALCGVVLLGGCGDAPQKKVAPLRYSSVVEMLEDRINYSVEMEADQRQASAPLHITLGVPVVAADSHEMVRDEVEKAAIYGVFRSFIHTDIEQIRVSARPLQISFNPSAATLLAAPLVELSLSRREALLAINGLLGIGTFDDLVQTDVRDGVQLDSWSEAFTPYCDTRQGRQLLLKVLTPRAEFPHMRSAQ